MAYKNSLKPRHSSTPARYSVAGRALWPSPPPSPTTNTWTKADSKLWGWKQRHWFRRYFWWIPVPGLFHPIQRYRITRVHLKHFRAHPRIRKPQVKIGPRTSENKPFR